MVYDPIKSFFMQGDDNWTIIDSFNNRLTTYLNRDEQSIQFDNFENENDYYFDAPDKFKGNKLASYGGYLTFVTNYETTSFGNTAKNMEVLLSGAGMQLVFRDGRLTMPYQDNTFNILLTEDSFTRLSDNEKVNRQTFMMVLSNIDELKIRAKFYDYEGLVTNVVSLKTVTLDHGVTIGSDRVARVKATAVEVCQCPEGYTGYSCEVSILNSLKQYKLKRF